MKITCPACASKFTMPDTASSKKLKCPSCATVFMASAEAARITTGKLARKTVAALPQEQENAALAPSSPRLILVLAAGAVFLLAVACLGVGIAGWFWTGKQSPTGVVTAYLETTRWEDRLRYVADPEQMRPKMAIWYADNPVHGLKSIRVGDAVKKADNPERFLVKASFVGSNGFAGSGEYVVRQTAQGYKIDWPASVGYNEMPLNIYVATTPAGQVRFRLMVTLNDLYVGNYYKSRDTHYSVRLFQDHPFADARGYISKVSDGGKELFRLLTDGQEHRVTLELRAVGPDGEPLRQPHASGFQISRLVSDSWISD
jgi:ribosomal protein S27E